MARRLVPAETGYRIAEPETGAGKLTSRIDQPSITQPRTQVPRKAEETDTRQAIQRHDPDFHHKKKDGDEEGGFKDPYEDLTDVSVPALRNFLAGLLDRMGAADAAPAPAHDVSVEYHRAPANPKAAAAMQAYQTGAVRGTPAQGVAHPSHMRPVEPAPAAAPAEPPSALDQAAAGLNRSDVLELIRELDRLTAAGITSITLEKGEGFLESIRAGIARSLQNP